MPKTGECRANARITQQTCYAVTVSDSSTCYPGPTGSLHLWPADTHSQVQVPLFIWILRCPRCELDVLLPLQQEQVCERSSLLISAPYRFPPTQGQNGQSHKCSVLQLSALLWTATTVRLTAGSCTHRMQGRFCHRSGLLSLPGH